MKQFFTKLRFALLLLALGAIPLFFSSSSGCKTSSIAPPAPPAEVPAPVTLKAVNPEDFTVSIDALAPSNSFSISASKSVEPGGQHSELITSGYVMVEFAEDNFLFPALQSIADWGIPISKDIKCVQETVEFSTATGFLQGVHEMTAVFSVPVDFDGNGEPDGCSGNTTYYTDQQWSDGSCTMDELTKQTCEPRHPICGLIWMGGAQYLAWKWIQIPIDDVASTPVDESTIGKGEFKMYVDELEGFNVALQINYEEMRPLDEEPDKLNTSKTMENYMRLRNNYTVAFTGFGAYMNDIREFGWHQDIRSWGPEASAQKLLNINNFLDFYDIDTATDEGVARTKYLGQWIEDELYWSGRTALSGLLEGVPVDEEGPLVCAILRTGQDANLSACSDLGISVEGIQFTSDFSNDQVAIPSTFLESPDQYVNDQTVCPNLF